MDQNHENSHLAALRRSGVPIRAIALATGRSPNVIQGIMVRLGLAGRPWPRTLRPVRLSQTARRAVALLSHPQARHLTWRQREVLAGRVRGEPAWRIAATLGIRPDATRWHAAAARARLERLDQGRSRRVRRREASTDLATLLAAVDAGIEPALAGQEAQP